ncbi:hypothetical protein [Pelomonas sp. KK5]|uniref:hypothetical protein n=1 Tax=Pelomonas sp. KK5 TaxID=1855730 RepID=UPI00117D7D14|nr:hypothetical protein [Pelomonas sp. KK5]
MKRWPGWMLVPAGAALAALLMWRFGAHAPPAPDPVPSDVPPPAVLAARASAVAPPSSAPARPAYLRHYDPAMELCRQPPLSAESEAALAKPGSAMERYMQVQADDLKAYVIDALLARGDDQSRVAVAMLRGDVAGVAEIARRTDDGMAYGMAWQVCQGRGAQAVMRRAAAAADAAELDAEVEQERAATASNCDALSLERWAQLQPDDAAPWLHQLDAARRANDEGAVAQALYRLGQARELRSRWPWLGGQVMAVLPDDAPLGGRMQLLTDAIGRDAALVAGLGVSAASKSCEGAALQDGNRRQQCERVAELLRGRSDRLLDRTVGARMGERLGLPPIQPDLAAIKAMQERHADRYGARLDKPTACDALRLMEEDGAEVARLGEWEALVSRFGKP